MASIVIRCFSLEARALPATGSKVAGGADTRPLRRRAATILRMVLDGVPGEGARLTDLQDA